MTSVFFFLMGAGHGGGGMGASGVRFWGILAGAVVVLGSVAGGVGDFRRLVGGRNGDIGVGTGVDCREGSRTASSSQ